MQTKTETAVEGTIIFNDAIIIGPPGNFTVLKISSSAINVEKIQKAYPNLDIKPFIYVIGFLRLCKRGEYQSSDYKCL